MHERDPVRRPPLPRMHGPDRPRGIASEALVGSDFGRYPPFAWSGFASWLVGRRQRMGFNGLPAKRLKGVAAPGRPARSWQDGGAYEPTS